MSAKVIFHNDPPLEKAGEGVSRRILTYTDQLMMVEVHFAKGAIGMTHTHPHTQCTYVQSGRFRFTIGSETAEVTAGDSLSFPPDLPHGTLCMDEGVLLDVFSPMREDFLDR